MTTSITQCFSLITKNSNSIETRAVDKEEEDDDEDGTSIMQVITATPSQTPRI